MNPILYRPKYPRQIPEEHIFPGGGVRYGKTTLDLFGDIVTFKTASADLKGYRGTLNFGLYFE
jgi:hypothetical protein